MGVSKESISKFLIGYRFHVKLRILSPENCKQSLRVKSKNNAYRKVNGASAIYFRCNTPAYAYPLSKTHKLTPENLLNVHIKEIPVRLLQSAGNISTSRITAFLEFILKLICAEFCKNCPNNFCQDSRQCIGDLLMWKERLTKKLETAKQKTVFYIVAADVKALYPSLYRDTVTKALECACRSIPTTAPLPVKSSSNWTKFAWTMRSLNMETNCTYKKRNHNRW